MNFLSQAHQQHAQADHTGGAQLPDYHSRSGAAVPCAGSSPGLCP